MHDDLEELKREGFNEACCLIMQELESAAMATDYDIARTYLRLMKDRIKEIMR